MIYLGPRRLELTENRYRTVGLYQPEDWEGVEVAWSTGVARFLVIARSHPATISIFPSPLASESNPVRVIIRVEGGESEEFLLTSQKWTEVVLSSVHFQHSALVELKVTETYSEPPLGSRKLGVAIPVADFVRLE